MIDLAIIETGDGGDLILATNDIAFVTGVENMPYLSMYGGTSDWWANSLFLAQNEDMQFNSQTETVCKSVALNSEGRALIEQAVVNDLQFIKKQFPDTDIKVLAIIKSDDKLQINVSINGNAVAYYWHPAKYVVQAAQNLQGIGNWIIELNLIVS